MPASFDAGIKLEYPFCAVVATGPIGIAQGGNDHALAGRGMDELIVSGIDAHMGDPAAAGVEKYQVTDL